MTGVAKCGLPANKVEAARRGRPANAQSASMTYDQRNPLWDPLASQRRAGREKSDMEWGGPHRALSQGA